MPLVGRAEIEQTAGRTWKQLEDAMFKFSKYVIILVYYYHDLVKALKRNQYFVW